MTAAKMIIVIPVILMIPTTSVLFANKISILMIQKNAYVKIF